MNTLASDICSPLAALQENIYYSENKSNGSGPKRGVAVPASGAAIDKPRTDTLRL
jgi:hypothetical protein